jgi:hypothetical protein
MFHVPFVRSALAYPTVRKTVTAADRQPVIGPAQAELALPDHANVRGPDYYH